jgi:hypothetical protein
MRPGLGRAGAGLQLARSSGVAIQPGRATGAPAMRSMAGTAAGSTLADSSSEAGCA